VPAGKILQKNIMAKPSSPIAAQHLEWYEKLIATNPKISRKGATVPYTALNGHMFSFLTAGGLALRLPAAEREPFLTKYHARLCEAYGVVQREYVMVPDELLADTGALRPWFDASLAYVATLKPKPAKKAKGR